MQHKPLRCFPLPYLIEHCARYGKPIVRLPKGGDGFKTDLMYVAERCKGKWSNRERGYVLSFRGLNRFVRMAGFVIRQRQRLVDAGTHCPMPTFASRVAVNGVGA